MGNNGSKFVKKIVSPFSSTIECSGTDHSQTIVKSNSPVIVLSRKGSMFFDEDGDLAHEFYVEVPSSRKGCKATMKKVLHNLIPQGEVAHQFPRLHVDFPIILHQFSYLLLKSLLLTIYL
ncbi:Tumor suppressor candidate 2 [Blattella germanica]|nr:Tumor suppressor candidate 2 [Blattella germanica]